MDISFIIVNYNTTELTTECLRSIYQFTHNNSFEIIVVDNASPDRSIDTITVVFPNVKLINNLENLGFGPANNIGVAHAKGKYVFLLNSDTQLISDAAEVFFNYMESPDHGNAACCGGALVDGKGSDQVSYGNFPSIREAIAALGPLLLFKRYFQRHLSSGVFNYSDEIRRVDYICGADLFCRAEVLKRVGQFDPAFFLYFEEVELAKRLRQAGYHSVIIPEVKIIHHEGASQDADKLKPQKIQQFAKSRRLYFQKCNRGITAVVINKIYAFQAFIFLLTKRNKAYLTTARILFNN